MTAEQGPGSGQSLPPIHSLLGQIYQCRFAGCQQMSSDREEVLRHEQICDASRNDGRPFQGFAPAQFPVQAPQHDTRFALRASSMSSEATDSAGSTSMFTPNVSRAPSVSAPSRPARTSSDMPHKARPRAHSRQSSSPYCHSEDDGAVKMERAGTDGKKKGKERYARKQQAAVHQREEDFLRNYCDWECVEQSRGNGNGAGLHTNKIHLMRVFERVGYAAVHRLFCEALAAGRVDYFREWCRRIIDEAARGPPEEAEQQQQQQPPRSPFAGTFLHRAGDRPCDHADAKAQPCSTHGHPDWRECRRVHTDAVFEENVARYQREMQGQQQQQMMDAGRPNRPATDAGADAPATYGDATTTDAPTPAPAAARRH